MIQTQHQVAVVLMTFPVDGGGGANNNPPTFKYLVELCINPIGFVVVESGVALNNGQAVKVASTFPLPNEACWVVLSPSPEPATATVTNIYIDCTECADAAESYYLVEDCETGTNQKLVTSLNTPLTIGQAVNISGAPNAGICFEVIGFAVTGNDATVLAIFPDCLSCEE